MKYIKLFEEINREEEDELSAFGFDTDDLKLRRFAQQVSDEILDEYDYAIEAGRISARDYSPEEMYDYIKELCSDNDITADEVIADFEWRAITHELGLGNI
jgi:hypothetical protein